jgi:hypothetical protein
MNDAGREGISEGFRMAQSARAVLGGAGATGSATPPLTRALANAVEVCVRMLRGKIRLLCRSVVQQLEWLVR